MSEATVRRAVKGTLTWKRETRRKVSDVNKLRRLEATSPAEIRHMRTNLRNMVFVDASFARFRPGEFVRGYRYTDAWEQPGHPVRKPLSTNYTLVQFYGAISLRKNGSVARSPLIWVPPTPGTGKSLNSHVYTRTVCTALLKWAQEAMGHQDLIWLQDGAKPHAAKATVKWQSQRGMKIAVHPPQSPDLNPIEKVWAVLKPKICTRRPRTWTGFYKMMQQAWQEVPDKVLKDAITCLPSAMAAVHEQPGLHVH